MKEEVIEILKEYGGEIGIIDFDIKFRYQGVLITDVVLTAEEEIQFWSGNPEGSHSEEIILDEGATYDIYGLIIDSF